MNTIILNIGLNIGPDAIRGTVDLSSLFKALKVLNVTSARVRMSNTEPTLVVHTEEDANNIVEDMDRIAGFLCHVAQQEAIAYTIDGVGYMVGPKASEWGPFNASYFITE
jgi:hypothetical protein